MVTADPAATRSLLPPPISSVQKLYGSCPPSVKVAFVPCRLRARVVGFQLTFALPPVLLHVGVPMSSTQMCELLLLVQESPGSTGGTLSSLVELVKPGHCGLLLVSVKVPPTP